jgi:CelD/BcsL family acetyltransferase involved in cellulose biosynthesis
LIEKNLNQFHVAERFVAGQPSGLGLGTHVVLDTSPTLTISLYDDIADVSQIWLKFQQHAALTFYQTFQWCSNWQQTVGPGRGCSPRILVARDASGKVIFILPFQLREAFGLKILEWHAYPSVNYGYGVFDREFLPIAAPWFAQNLTRILGLIGSYDILSLQDMPMNMEGQPHPLSSHFNMRAANHSYAMDLQADYETLYTSKRSAESRRSNRKRDAKLVAYGDLSFGLPASYLEAHVVLDDMFGHQSRRLAEFGVHGIFDTTEREFVHRLVEDDCDGKPVLMPFVLKCNGETLAVMLGGYFNNCYWALISSLAPGAVRKYSPGDYALRHMIEACCRLGMTRLDFAAGDTGYKPQWADETIELNVALWPQSLLGFFYVLGVAAALTTKRVIKQSPALRSFALQLRRFVAGKKDRSGC